VQALITEERTIVVEPLTANDQVPPKNASPGAVDRLRNGLAFASSSGVLLWVP
jgi:hypothetical protein